MRTTDGLKRVDVIYRRVDDDFSDPSSSARIPPSAAPAYSTPTRAGNVTVTTHSALDSPYDKAVYAYVRA